MNVPSFQSFHVLTPVVDIEHVDADILREHIHLRLVRCSTLLRPQLQEILVVGSWQHSVCLRWSGVVDSVGLAGQLIGLTAVEVSTHAEVLIFVSTNTNPRTFAAKACMVLITSATGADAAVSGFWPKRRW